MDRGVAVVTGTSSGFGLLTAVELARFGFTVYATMRDPERSQPLRQALEAARAEATILGLDVCDPDSVDRAIGQVLGEAGVIDVLVNNAGLMIAGCVEELSDEELQRQLDTNLFGVRRVTRAVLPVMRARMHGRIINISSAGTWLPQPGFGGYHASKAALEALSTAMRHELRRFNIDVCLVQPGLFPTDMLERNWNQAERMGRADSPYRRLNDALGRAFDRARRMVAGADPGTVARTVARVAITNAPRARYPVGVDAWGMALGSLLPPRWIDRMIDDSLDR